MKDDLHFKNLNILKLLGLLGLVFAMENLNYSLFAPYFGQYPFSWVPLANFDLGFQTISNKIFGFDLLGIFDNNIPWVTFLFPYYIIWPFIWILFIPLIILIATDEKGLCSFFINGIIMHTITMFIYILLPTVTNQMAYIDGLHPASGLFIPLQELKNNGAFVPFFDELFSLAQQDYNIWGSCPSYHNYFASLLIFYGLFPNVENKYKWPMIIMGILISISTLTLHQHCILDIFITYMMTLVFLIITERWKLDDKLLNWLKV